MKFLLNRANLIILVCLLFVAAGLSITAFVKADSAPTAKEENKSAAVSAPEKRCGWFSNPTPGNAWLNDKDGEWTIAEQGGHQADGDWPGFKDNQWIKTNGSYGYGCACITATIDHKTKEVTKIISSAARPISVCRKDRSLKKPE